MNIEITYNEIFLIFISLIEYEHRNEEVQKLIEKLAQIIKDN